MTTLILLVALTFAMGVTPLVRQLALRIDFVAVPKSDRLHTVATPMMGGVALYLALTGALLVLTAVLAISDSPELDQTFSLNEMLVVILAGTVLAVIGLWDDRVDLPSKLKLGLQAAPVIVLSFFTDIQINMPLPEIINGVLTCCWFLYLINAYNYTDNMDGLAGMIATVAAMFFTVIALVNGQALLATLAAAVAGTSFGFLRYNLFKTNQKIFMGDVGSMFLGFLLAVIGLKLTFPAESPWVTWPVPVLVLGVPIFDTGMVFVSRWRRGQSFLQGGTDHLSHRLSRLNFGRYGTPFAVGMLGSALGCTAIIVMHSDLQNALATQLMVGGCALYLLYKLEFAQSHTFITGREAPVENDETDEAEEERQSLPQPE